jgi:purine-nucleoside phosphorylase
MEAAGLYGLAAEYHVRALAVLTVSDHIRRREHLSAEARRSSFDAMIQIAFETAFHG